MTLAVQAAPAVLALAFLAAVSTPRNSQTDAHGTDLSHAAHFELGETTLQPGDSIHIDEIRGSANIISPGNVYEVKGTYRLASHPGALLSSNVTSNVVKGPISNHDDPSESRSTLVQQGEGHFDVFLHFNLAGYPHLSFYPAHGGGSFGSIYFGSGDSLWKPKLQSSTR